MHNPVEELHLEQDKMPGWGQRGLEEFSQWTMLQNGVDRLQIRSDPKGLWEIIQQRNQYVIYLVTAFTDTHEKVIWFNVSMNEILVVEIFNSAYHLERKS